MMRYLLAAGLLLALPFAPAAAQQGATTPAVQLPAPAPSAEPAPPATAVQPAASASRSGSVDSLQVDIPADLQHTLDELAATLDRLARRVANDPELRASAVRTAQSFVTVAQVLVNQQADLLQEALKTAAERLSEVARDH